MITQENLQRYFHSNINAVVVFNPDGTEIAIGDKDKLELFQAIANLQRKVKSDISLNISGETFHASVQDTYVLVLSFPTHSNVGKSVKRAIRRFWQRSLKNSDSGSGSLPSYKEEAASYV